MAIRFVVAHRVDPNNIGDMASNPLQYFLKEDEYQVVDVASIGSSAFDGSLPMIVGGGGLIGNDFMGDFWPDTLQASDYIQLNEMYQRAWTLTNQRYQETYQEFHLKYQALISDTLSKIDPTIGPRFVWGAGHNGDPDSEFEKIRWPRSFNKFKLVGLRDFHKTSRYRWVPCASCMHPAFDRKYEIKNDVIWFEHKKQMIKDFGSDPIPRFINTGNNMDQTIELLGSSNIILTNSYHGAYWGMLLKKRVIVVGGTWSSKFKFMKHFPSILNKKDHWKDAVEKASIYENALEDCRTANREYWQEIQNNI
jgi:hypothetical protein